MKERFHGDYISNLSLKQKRANSAKAKVHLQHVDIRSPPDRYVTAGIHQRFARHRQTFQPLKDRII